MDPMAAIRETYFQECDEQLLELETGLAALEEGDSNLETVNAVFRAVHSIKGGAGAFQLARLVRFAHAFETCLDLVRGRKLALSGDVLRVLFRASDCLADIVKAERNGADVDEPRIGAQIDELNVLAGKSGGAGAAEPPAFAPEPIDFQPLTIAIDDEPAGPPATFEQRKYEIRFRPRPALYEKGNDPIRLIRELARLGEVTTACETGEAPPLDEISPGGAYLQWRIELKSDQPIAAVSEIFDFVVDDCDLSVDEIGAMAQAVEPAPAALMTVAEDETSGSEDKDASPQPPTADRAANAAAPEGSEEGEGPAAAAAADAAKSLSDAAKRDHASKATIRVELDRVDRLINLVGELVINQAMLSQRVMEAGVARSSSVAAGLTALEQLTREIQEGVMAARAQPVRPLFQRMARIVREVSEATEKSVRLRTDGEATEVDRTVVERLADPLTHMVRNAVDHGIETPAERIAAGKPEQGEVRLSAAHRSGRIVIEVADDGAGIDRPRVREAAIRKSLIPADAQLSDEEIDNLLFLPGFSTAKSLSNISGRGVGMDVVKSSIQALGGRITISSRPGVGSTFSMSLPLTLAVLDGMVVKAADQTLVIPLTAIVETLRPRQGEVHELGENSRVIADRDRFLPLSDVGKELGFRDVDADPFSGVVLVVETEVSTRTALIVDEIFDQRQVVIKSLEANYRQVPGIAAATILGDGRVALILDIDTFVARANRKQAAAPPLLAAAS